MINNFIFILILFAIPGVYSQEQEFTGKVINGVHPLQEILVVNLRGELETKTDVNGFFKLKAKAGDTIVITDPGIIAMKYTVTDDWFSGTRHFEVVLMKGYELEELVIEKDNRLTSEALRIIPEGTKKYTTAERRVQTGARVGPRGIDGGIVFNGDAIINIFTGRKKVLKKALEVERNEYYFKVLSAVYDEETIVAVYHIPKEFAAGFIYFIMEDKDIAAALKAENPLLIEQRMPALALKYLEIIGEKPEPENFKE